MQNKKFTSCAFTGHRPHKLPWKNDETAEGCIALKAELARQIEKLADMGVTDFLSGMAEGTDTWAAQAVLALRENRPEIKLHCIIPHIGQADGWGEAARELYKCILDQADSIVRVSREYHKDCMMDRNRFLVDHCDILLAVYNGELRGGTAATVRYAQEKGKEVKITDPRNYVLPLRGR